MTLISMASYEKTDKAYDFLVEREVKNKSFSIQELAIYTGWHNRSVQTYLSKKWRIYIKKNKNGTYQVNGLQNLSKQEFRQIHSQVVDSTKNSPEIREHLEKSKQFALIAVCNYNNPLIKLKTHSFIVDIVIAYTALFHAIFEKNNVPYFFKNKSGNYEIIDNEPKAFDLLKCCKVYWQGKQTAIEANLEFLMNLRNKIEHRSLPSIDLYVEGECQAAITNFENLLIKEFGGQHSLGISLAISMQLTKTSQKNRNSALKDLQSENYKVIKNYIEKYRRDLDEKISMSQEYRISVFLIPKLGNHAKSADLCIEYIKQECLTEEELKEYEKGIVLIKNKKNPYVKKPGKVTTEVQEKIQNFNMWMHTQCRKYYKARPLDDNVNYKGEYCGWVEGFDGYLYTQSWVDFLIKKLSSKDEFNKVKSFK